jgi:nicotinate-nucleotide adenylyltransferase
LRIGILGGTFDPPHVAHLALARAAISHLELDEVIFMPVARNPLKHKPVSSAKQRLTMTEILIKDQPKMAVSNLEMVRGGQSYAVDTLGELQAAQPADYWFIIGADALKDLKLWKNPDKLLTLCRLAVAVRPPLSEESVKARIPEEYRDKVDLISMPPMDVASFDVRDRIHRGKPLGDMITPDVLDYIQQNNLYRD